jgi:hypothetical protein
MIVAIHQPQYLSWVPFFDKMDACELFVFLDTVQFQRRGVQNRNQILGPDGPLWLTVPVNASRETLIQDVTIAENPWQHAHVRSIETSYQKAPFYKDYAPELLELLSRKWERLVDLNIATTSFLAKALGITTRCVRASELNVTGAKQDLILDICTACQATDYLSGTGARAYQTSAEFSGRNIRLLYQNYEAKPYPQRFGGEDFTAGLSALDLIFNLGPASRDLLVSGRGAALTE